MISIIVFIILSIVGFGFFTWNILKIKSNIGLGRDLDRTDNKKERLRTMLLVAFGQKKMFSKPLVGFFTKDHHSLRKIN